MSRPDERQRLGEGSDDRAQQSAQYCSLSVIAGCGCLSRSNERQRLGGGSDELNSQPSTAL